MDKNINNNLINNVNAAGATEKKPINKLFIYIPIAVLLIIIFVWVIFFRGNDQGVVIRDPNTGQIIPDLGNGSGDIPTYGRDGDNGNQAIGGGEDYTDPVAQALYQVWREPVAGYATIDTVVTTSNTIVNSQNPASSTIVTATTTVASVYFVDKKNGNIYRASNPDYRTIRVTNTTIPDVFDAHFSRGAEYVAIRYIDTNGLLSTVVSAVPRTENSGISMGNTVGGRVLDLDFAPHNNSLAYIQEESNGSAVYIHSPTSFSSTKIIDLPIKDLTLSWTGENTIILQTKPAQSEEQQNFVIDINRKTITSLSTNSGNALFGDGNQHIVSNGGNLMFYNGPYETGINKNIVTLVEKCTFTSSPAMFCAVPESGNINMDSWYKGLSQSNDFIYFIDDNEGESSFLISISDISKTPVDVQKITISPRNSLLGVKNKVDGSLWVIDLTKINN